MPLEQQLLPNPALQAHYGDVTWLFVSRNFKDDAVDRETLRTHDRFGISSWPQMIVFDPRDDRVLQEMPRDLAGFTAGLVKHRGAVQKPAAADREAIAQLDAAAQFERAGNSAERRKLLEQVAGGRDGVTAWLFAREQLRGGEERSIAEQLADPDVRERCIALERIADLPAAQGRQHTDAAVARLADAEEHLIVRLRALRHLGRQAPQLVAANAKDLLKLPNDPFRYAVLEVVTAHPDPKLTDTLLQLFDGAGGAVPSINPNVLRMHAGKALGAAGDLRAVASLAAVSRRADARNGLTGTAIDALAAIAARADQKGRAQVVEELLASYPPELAAAGLDSFGARAEPMLLGLAKRVHAALSKVTGTSLPALPAHWQGADRESHLAQVARAVGG